MSQINIDMHIVYYYPMKLVKQLPALDITQLKPEKDTPVPEGFKNCPHHLIDGVNYYITGKTQLVGDDRPFYHINEMERSILKGHKIVLPDNPHITDEIKAEVAAVQVMVDADLQTLLATVREMKAQARIELAKLLSGELIAELELDHAKE